jgi:TRAP-type uncharacterized transport system fused permease subunit
MTFMLYPMFKSGGKLSRASPATTALAFGGLALSTYHWVFEADLIQRSGDPSTMDLVVGTVLVVLTFEAARRIMGLALPIVCLGFLLYGLFGSTCRATSPIAATASTRWWNQLASAPRASTASRPWSRRPTSSCSSCSAPSSSRRA